MIRILTFICIIIFFSCSSSKNVDSIGSSSSDNDFKTLGFEVMAEGDNSGFIEKSNQVILSLDQLDKTWEKAFTNYTRKKPIPIVDFEKQMSLLVAMGEKSSGGFFIKIDSIIEDQNSITVNIIEEHPGKDCQTASVIVYPYQIISIEKSSKEVVFKSVKNIKNCEK